MIGIFIEWCFCTWGVEFDINTLYSFLSTQTYFEVFSDLTFGHKLNWNVNESNSAIISVIYSLRPTPCLNSLVVFAGTSAWACWGQSWSSRVLLEQGMILQTRKYYRKQAKILTVFENLYIHLQANICISKVDTCNVKASNYKCFYTIIT